MVVDFEEILSQNSKANYKNAEHCRDYQFNTVDKFDREQKEKIIKDIIITDTDKKLCKASGFLQKYLISKERFYKLIVNVLK